MIWYSKVAHGKKPPGQVNEVSAARRFGENDCRSDVDTKREVGTRTGTGTRERERGNGNAGTGTRESGAEAWQHAQAMAWELIQTYVKERRLAGWQVGRLLN